MRRLITLAAAAALSTLGLLAAPAASASLTCPAEPASYGAANLISYNDSDTFAADGTGVAGDWQSQANATVSQGTGTTMLHTTALKDTVPAAGTSSVKLACAGSFGQIPVTAGKTYRVGGYVSVPRTGGTVTWELAGYNSSGVFQGWTVGTAQTVAATGYKWYHADITIPAGVVNVIGVREDVSAMQANDVILTDEVTMAPLRAALIMGQRGQGTATTGNGKAIWEAGNTAIGPSQDNKIFYSAALPASYVGSDCADLATDGFHVTCIMAYKSVMTQAALNTFFASVPATQSMIIVPHQEPENGDYTSGAAFVSYFETEAKKIRTATSGAANVQIWQDSSGSGYGTGHPGADCSYVVPPDNGTNGGTDGYAIDYYQEKNTTGNAIPTGDTPARWTNWINCISTGSASTAGTPPRPVGLGEFGYGINGGPGSCTGSGTETTRNSALTADLAGFQGLTESNGAPVAVLSYWWVDDSLSESACRDWNFPATSTTGATWKAAEIQNGGGAN